MDDLQANADAAANADAMPPPPRASLGLLQQDALVHALSFLDVADLALLDRAICNRDDRIKWWLPNLSLLISPPLNCYMFNCTACCCAYPERKSWGLVLKWIVRRGMRVVQLSVPPDEDFSDVCDSLAGLAFPAQVTTLDLRDCTGLKFELLDNLPPLTGLRSLDLSDSDIDDNSLHAGLLRLPELHELSISNCKQLTRSPPLEHLTRLRKLFLRHCAFVDDALLQQLAACRNSLEDLDLHGCKGVTESGFALLKHHTALQGLDLSFTGITDAGAAHLETLTELVALELAGCNQLTPSFVGSWLSRLPNLEVLMLKGCKVGDAELVVVAENLKNLTKLNLRCCDDITDDGLSLLINLEWLAEIDLGHCTRLTEDGMLEVCLRAPSLSKLVLCGCEPDLSDDALYLLDGSQVEIERV